MGQLPGMSGSKDGNPPGSSYEGTAKGVTIFTDENRSCFWLESENKSRERKAVDHSKTWAEDRVGPEILQRMCGVRT